MFGNVVITTDDVVICRLCPAAAGGVVHAVADDATRQGRSRRPSRASAARHWSASTCRCSTPLMWGGGAALGAIGGVLLAMITPLTPDLGQWTLVQGFAAMTLGGFGSLGGAVVGGILLGITEKLLGFYVNTVFIEITGYLVPILCCCCARRACSAAARSCVSDGVRAQSLALFWLLPLVLAAASRCCSTQYQQYVVNTDADLRARRDRLQSGRRQSRPARIFQRRLFRPRRLHQRHPDGCSSACPGGSQIIPAGIVGGLAGCIASIPALRGVRLFYLAIMTLAFGELMRWIYIRWEPLTGGSMGMAVPTASLFGWTLEHRPAPVLRLPRPRRPGGRRHRPAAALALRPRLPGDQGQRDRRGRHGHPDRPLHRARASPGAASSSASAGAMFAALVGHLTPVSFDLTELILRIRHHHGGRPRQPDRLGHRCRRHHRRAAGLRQLPRLPGTGVRRADHPGHPVPAATASPACWPGCIRFSTTATTVTDTAQLLEVRDLTVRFGGLIAVNGVSFRCRTAARSAR